MQQLIYPTSKENFALPKLVFCFCQKLSGLMMRATQISAGKYSCSVFSRGLISSHFDPRMSMITVNPRLQTSSLMGETESTCRWEETTELNIREQERICCNSYTSKSPADSPFPAITSDFLGRLSTVLLLRDAISKGLTRTGSPFLVFWRCFTFHPECFFNSDHGLEIPLRTPGFKTINGTIIMGELSTDGSLTNLLHLGSLLQTHANTFLPDKNV